MKLIKKRLRKMPKHWLHNGGKAGIIEGNDIPEGSIETVSTIETEPKKRDSATIKADNSAQEQPKKKGFFKTSLLAKKYLLTALSTC